MTLSVVIPTLNEAAALPRLLSGLAGAVDEIVVADGGSTDATVPVARAAGLRVVVAPGGRGPQLNAGAAVASGDRLWFLHADSTVPPDLAAQVRSSGARWGCCAVRVGSADPRLRMAGRVMNLRARVTGSCTGDMGIWVDRALFSSAGGFAPLAALEDLDLSDRLRHSEPWSVITPRVTTSARRWEAHGITRTMLWMLALRLGYRLGIDPDRLARAYLPRSAADPVGDQPGTANAAGSDHADQASPRSR